MTKFIFRKNFSVWSLRSTALRRFFDLQFASVYAALHAAFAARGASTQKVLDFGSGYSPYGDAIPSTATVETLDAHHEAAYRDWSALPADAAYDVIMVLEVLEHLADPAGDFLKPARARLKPGGEIWISVPFAARLHPCPDDWNRWTEQGFKRLLEQNGYRVLEFLHRGPSPRVLGAKLAYFNFKCLKSPLGFPLGMALLPLTVSVLALLHLAVPQAKASDDDPLGFFVRVAAGPSTNS